jgi:hypothetical protein
MPALGRAFVGQHQTARDGSRDFHFFHVVGFIFSRSNLRDGHTFMRFFHVPPKYRHLHAGSLFKLLFELLKLSF